MFDSIQLIPASSGYDMHSAQKDKAHLPNIKRETGIEYRDMLFFDDESPNIVKVIPPPVITNSCRRPAIPLRHHGCLPKLGICLMAVMLPAL